MWAKMKYVFETWRSNGTMASITPEIPPRVNMVRKPRAKSIGVSRWRTPRQSVASHEKILIPVGTAMIEVVIIIGTRIQAWTPAVDMWWAQTVKPRATVARGEQRIIL